MSRMTLVGSLLLLSLFGSLQSAPLPLDLIPERACIGISIRDLVDLKAKSDKLLKDRRDVPRFSELFDQAYKMLDLGWRTDEEKSAAIICASGKLAGYANDTDPYNQFQIGTVLPYKKSEDVLAVWKVEEAAFKKGEPVQVKGKRFDTRFGLTWAGARDGVVYMSETKQAVAAWMAAKTLRQTLPQERVKRLDSSDGLLYFGPPLLKIGQDQHRAEWAPPEFNDKEAEAYRRIARAANEARHVLAGYRLDDGIGLDLGVGFDSQGKDSQALLKAFAAPGRDSSLAGLPTGQLVGALGLVNADETNLEVARLLAAEAWLGLRTTRYLLESDTHHLRRILADQLKRLKAGSGGLYLPRQKDAGKLAAVVVLEPKKAETFMNELGALARVGDDTEFDPKAKAGKAEIEKLVKDLGDDDFDTREAATTKLGLIGVPALEALAQAEKSDDAEVRRRAGELRGQIEYVGELRKTELAAGLLKQAFHPLFGFKPNAEERVGVKVSYLTMRFAAEDTPYTGLFESTFGPHWNRIRIALVNGKVVAMLGSDVGLFDEALANVRDGKPGLEASPALTAFHKLAGAGRRAELHLAVNYLRMLTTPASELPKDFKPSGSLSSVGLRTGASDAGLDFWLPADSINDSLWWFRF